MLGVIGTNSQRVRENERDQSQQAAGIYKQ